MNASLHTLRPHIPAALVASQVGTWEFDVIRERCYFDALMSAMFGFSAQEGAQGLALSSVRTKFAAGDKPADGGDRRRVARDGSIFVHEMRVVPGPGIERWVLTRGRFEVDATGRVVYARGIAIDITEGKNKGFVEGQLTFVNSSDDAELTALDRATDAALLSYEAIRALGDTAPPSFARTAELLLHLMGLELASRQR